jgi:hypothetical protein
MNGVIVIVVKVTGLVLCLISILESRLIVRSILWLVLCLKKRRRWKRRKRMKLSVNGIV